MNKAQMVILWIVAILFLCFSIGYGLMSYADANYLSGNLFTFFVPIILIGGMAFITAGRKKKKDE